MFSWIHIEDLFQILFFIQRQKKLVEIFNCAAEAPVNNKDLMKAWRENMQVKFGLPAATWLLKIGAFFSNTDTELILKCRWMIPERLLNLGYEFKNPTIDQALKNLLRVSKKKRSQILFFEIAFFTL